GPVIVVVPVVSVSSSWLPPRGIVCGALNTALSKVIVSSPMFVFAITIACRRSIRPVTGVSLGLLTTILDGTQRPSNASTARRVRCAALRIGRGAGRVNNLRIQERIVMRNSSSKGDRKETGPPEGADWGKTPRVSHWSRGADGGRDLTETLGRDHKGAFQ